jgi:hypothetical protein
MRSIAFEREGSTRIYHAFTFGRRFALVPLHRSVIVETQRSDSPAQRADALTNVVVWVLLYGAFALVMFAASLAPSSCTSGRGGDKIKGPSWFGRRLLEL